MLKAPFVLKSKWSTLISVIDRICQQEDILSQFGWEIPWLFTISTLNIQYSTIIWTWLYFNDILTVFANAKVVASLRKFKKLLTCDKPTCSCVDLPSIKKMVELMLCTNNKTENIIFRYTEVNIWCYL